MALGLVFGVAGSLALGRVIRSRLLFEVQPGDPRTILAVGLLLVAVAMIACVVPARRATTAGLATMLRVD